MWKCSKCHESLEDSFDTCWSCGTGRGGEVDPSFQPVEDVEPDEEGEVDPSTPPVVQRPMREPICLHCESRRILLNVSISLTAETGAIGLKFRSLAIISGTQPLLADLCLDCGSVHRFHVRKTDRNWIIG